MERNEEHLEAEDRHRVWKVSCSMIPFCAGVAAMPCSLIIWPSMQCICAMLDYSVIAFLVTFKTAAGLQMHHQFQSSLDCLRYHTVLINFHRSLSSLIILFWLAETFCQPVTDFSQLTETILFTALFPLSKAYTAVQPFSSASTLQKYALPVFFTEINFKTKLFPVTNLGISVPTW